MLRRLKFGIRGLPVLFGLSAICAAEPASQAPANVSGAPDSLSALVAEALANNPEIKAEELQIKGLHGSPNHTWYLEPPEVGVEFYQTPIQSFPNPIKNQVEIDYSLQQAFPFPGKISSRIDAEHKHAEIGEADLESLKRRVTRDVKVTYYEIHLLDRRMEINRENQSLMARLVEIARRQYEVGLGRQGDILRAQTEATNLKKDSITFAQSRQSMEGMLNAYLSRDIRRPISTELTLTPAKADFSLEQLKPLLAEYHPSLRAMKADIDMKKAEKRMVSKELLPDFMVRGAYKDMLRMPPGTHGESPSDDWSLMVSMTVPFALWSLPKYNAEAAQNVADLGRSEQQYANMENMAAARLQQALLKANGNSDLARLYETVLLPQARQNLESNLAAYQGGKGEFTMLMDAYRELLMARENAEMALMQVLASQAELEEAVGLGLKEIQEKIAAGGGK